MPHQERRTKGELDDDICVLLKSVCDEADQEDFSTRERQIRFWQRLKFYWNNLSLIYWDSEARDYRVYDSTSDYYQGDQNYYDKPVNFFRAFLETIIAALSIQIPSISCVPDDADNPNDVSTAKAGERIAAQIYKHNDVVFLWLHALYIYCTEGMVACYSYASKDKKFGTYEEPQYKDEEVDGYKCPNCQQRIPDDIFSNSQLDEFSPNDNDVEVQDLLQNKGEPICPECGEELDPNLQKSKLTIPRLVGVTTKPKTRICLEVRGGLYIKIANYAREQADTPYLSYSYETSYVNVLECYPNLWEKMPRGLSNSSSGVNSPDEEYARLNPQYRGEYPVDNCTIKNNWLRPAAFNWLDKDQSDKLHRKFPNGAYVCVVNDVVADYCNEALDDHWTLTRNPLSDYLTFEPLGQLITNIQDIFNDLISLTLQTIEHGIIQTWVDPAVVDLNGQTQVEANPGMITAAKSQGGMRNLSEAFYSSKSAVLAPEIFGFFKWLMEVGQFVSGALPALFGGSQARGSSQTASEYAMQRNAAQQRLTTPWRMFGIWWKTIFGKVIPLYMKNLEADEKIVEKNAIGKWANTYIRKSELVGKIGDIELELGDTIPITDEQQADNIIKLMGINNAEIQAALTSPDNLAYIKKVTKIPAFKIPGEDDRQKQHEEINILINSEPIPVEPDEHEIIAAEMQGREPEMGEQSSVPIDPLVDNHAIEAATCRSWLIGEEGRLAKIENPAGYHNVLLHMKEHLMIQVQNMQQQDPNQETAQPGSGSVAPRPERIENASDARTPVE